MCYYSKIVRNKKYVGNKKNKGLPPAPSDNRALLTPIGCGRCKECRNQDARQWQARLLEDIKTHRNGKFVTLTLSNENYKKLYQLVKEEQKTLEARVTLDWERELSQKRLNKISNYGMDNQIAILAVKYFRERWRRKFKHSPRHWLATELGHNGTENIHLHGIIWTDKSFDDIRERWEYGFIWPRYERDYKINYVSERTVNYIIKYVRKVDKQHKYYKPRVLTSEGIGANYTKTMNAAYNKYKGKDTKETYTTNTGHEINLPIYWRNKIYTEEEREKLWLQRLDTNDRYIGGIKIDISKGMDEYFKLLQHFQELNTELGYGTDRIDWKRYVYELEHRATRQEARLK